MVNSKSAFWKALVFTVIIFVIGFVLGFFLETARTDKVELNLLNSEINLLDEQLRNSEISSLGVSCDQAKESTFAFADKIYREALQLEEFDTSSKFTNTLRIIHKRYDLLRVMLWMEGIELKEQCDPDFHTVVYLFDYQEEEDTNKKARQASMARLLTDLKNKYGDKILLIPIASNLDLESVNLIKDKYEITEIPAIIVDEKKVVRENVALNELENIIFETGEFQNLEGVIFKWVGTNEGESIILNIHNQ